MFRFLKPIYLQIILLLLPVAILGFLYGFDRDFASTLSERVVSILQRFPTQRMSEIKDIYNLVAKSWEYVQEFSSFSFSGVLEFLTALWGTLVGTLSAGLLFSLQVFEVIIYIITIPFWLISPVF